MWLKRRKIFKFLFPAIYCPNPPTTIANIEQHSCWATFIRILIDGVMFAFLGVCLFFNIPCMGVRVCVFSNINWKYVAGKILFISPCCLFIFAATKPATSNNKACHHNAPPSMPWRNDRKCLNNTNSSSNNINNNNNNNLA